jgi:YHS domain-containing protein
MDWLNENWVWLVVAVGAFILMTRMHSMGVGCGTGSIGGRRRHAGSIAEGNEMDEADMQHASGHGIGPSGMIDPVSRHAIAAPESAVSTVYRGRMYAFEDRQNRDAFEREPEMYLADGAVTGQAIANERARPHRHHGCC